MKKYRPGIPRFSALKFISATTAQWRDLAMKRSTLNHAPFWVNTCTFAFVAQSAKSTDRSLSSASYGGDTWTAWPHLKGRSRMTMERGRRTRDLFDQCWSPITRSLGEAVRTPDTSDARATLNLLKIIRRRDLPRHVLQKKQRRPPGQGEFPPLHSADAY